MENFEIQALREIVEDNNEYVVENFEKMFKEIRVKGKRKSLNSSSTMFTETLPLTYYTEAEQKEIEAMYIGTESEGRKRYQGTCSYSQQRAQSLDRRQISLSRLICDQRPRYDPRPRYD